MNHADSLVAALPVALLVFLMTKRRPVPSNLALPVSAGVMYLLLLSYFRAGPVLVHAAVVEGLLTALTPISIVFGAVLLFKTMERSGSMATIRQWLNGVTGNRVAQLMIIGWGFSFLIEGVSGFGTPAALAAPLLVGLGFPPLRVAIVCLMMNTVPVSFGAVGMPIWFGLGELGLSPEEVHQIARKTSTFHLGGAFLIPPLALRLVVPWSEIRANARYVALVLVGTMTAYVAASFWSVEFPSIAAGSTALLLSLVLARRGVGLAADAEKAPPARTHGLLKAAFPLWATVLVLLITRLEPLGLKPLLLSTDPAFSVGPLKISASGVLQWRGIFGTGLNWSHALLYVPSILPFVLVSSLTFLFSRNDGATVRTAWRESFSRVGKPIGAFLGALVLVKLMMAGGEHSAAARIGSGLAASAGGVWQGVAVYLGAIGAFFSGSCTVSNLTFGGIQDATAAQLGLSRTTILSLQAVGGAIGNMVCIHNIVAVCSILGLHGQEKPILRATVVPVLLYGALASLIALAF